MTTEQELLRQALRADLPSLIHRCYLAVSTREAYMHNWHIDVLAHNLVKVMTGEITRLIITLPPRSLKSICCSVAFPAFVLGHDPTARIICASYSLDLAAKHARDCRAVLEADWYQDAYPNCRLDRSKRAELEMMTTRRGGRQATSIGGTLTGRGGNLFIIDDPMKADDALSETARRQLIEWLTNTAMSRLDNKQTDAIVVVMQRLHADDLVGYLLEQQSGWVHLNLPAIATEDQCFDLDAGRLVGRRKGEALHPEREPVEVLEALRLDMGSYVFEAQYQQDPIPLEGGLIKWHWFQFYDNPPEKTPNDLIVQSWDTASKGADVHSYSVCSTWLRRGADHYLLDLHRARLEYPALKKLVIELAQQFAADVVLIEDRASGTQLIQEIRDNGSFRTEAIEPEGDKVTRMYVQTAKLEAKHVFLPHQAPWLDAFQREVLQFPNGRHDDQIDSLSQFLGWQAPGSIGPHRYIFNNDGVMNDPDAPWNSNRY